jgi:hypothetical protein
MSCPSLLTHENKLYFPLLLFFRVSFQGRDIISNSAAKTLRHFCRWQHLRFMDSQRRNHPNAKKMMSYDASILMTREDLCRLPQSCDTLGLAQLGQICNTASACAVIEDNGLSAAFTIAHELAHM